MLMSREKIGQLFMVGFEGTSVTPDLTAFIKEYKPGGVILFSRNLESIEQIVELTNALQACSPHRSGGRSGLAAAEELHDFPSLRGVGAV
jgi:beta-N-acetylhexosaminidase